MKFLHERQQVRLRFRQRFFEIDTNAGKLVLLDEGAQRADQVLARSFVSDHLCQETALPLFIIQILNNWNDGKLWPALTNQIQSLESLVALHVGISTRQIVGNRPIAGFSRSDQMRPLRHQPIHLVQVSFER